MEANRSSPSFNDSSSRTGLAYLQAKSFKLLKQVSGWVKGSSSFSEIGSNLSVPFFHKVLREKIGRLLFSFLLADIFGCRLTTNDSKHCTFRQCIPPKSIGTMDSPDDLSCCKEARERRCCLFIDLHPSHKEMDCRGDQKGPFMERKLRFLEKVKGIMLPFFPRDLGQIKKDIPILSSTV